MALTKEVKESIVKKYARNSADTGSAEVQIALLTEEINILRVGPISLEQIKEVIEK